jgi:hypothetical protein
MMRIGALLLVLTAAIGACEGSANDADSESGNSAGDSGADAGTGGSSTVTAGAGGGAGETGTTDLGGGGVRSSDDADAGEGGSSSGAGSQGDAGESATCDDFVACGGDPTGTWTWVGTCQDGDMPLAACPEATFRGALAITGTITIGASWTREYDEAGETEIRVPRSCYENQTCAQIYPTPRETETLSESDGVCIVTETASAGHHEYTDPITIGETSFVDQVDREVEFCQQGDELRLKALDDNPFAFVHAFKRQ